MDCELIFWPDSKAKLWGRDLRHAARMMLDKPNHFKRVWRDRRFGGWVNEMCTISLVPVGTFAASQTRVECISVFPFSRFGHLMRFPRLFQLSFYSLCWSLCFLNLVIVFLKVVKTRQAHFLCLFPPYHQLGQDCTVFSFCRHFYLCFQHIFKRKDLRPWHRYPE